MRNQDFRAPQVSSVMLAMIAGLHNPRRKPQVNAIDQVFGTYRLLRQGEAGED